MFHQASALSASPRIRRAPSPEVPSADFFRHDASSTPSHQTGSDDRFPKAPIPHRSAHLPLPLHSGSDTEIPPEMCIRDSNGAARRLALRSQRSDPDQAERDDPDPIPEFSACRGTSLEMCIRDRYNLIYFMIFFCHSYKCPCYCQLIFYIYKIF